jgi:hypothetical protein
VTISTGIGRGYGNSCQDCHQHYHAKVHQRTNRVYTHDYVGTGCASGRHNRRSEITCLNVVGKEPRDFVCGCTRCKDGSFFRTTVARSDSQGVIQCRL